MFEASESAKALLKPITRISVQRLIIVVGLLALLLAGFKRATDPLEAFRRRTGFDDHGTARVLTTTRTATIDGSIDFAIVFDADRETVAAWLQQRPEGWRGWFHGEIPHWITGQCPIARQALIDVPIEPSNASTATFLFRVSSLNDDHGDLIVIDPTIGRVWFLFWGR